MVAARDQMHRQLDAAVRVVDESKATRVELESAVAQLNAADQRMDQGLTTLSQVVLQTSQSVVSLDQQSRQIFATQTSVSNVAASVEDSAKRLDELSKERFDINSLLDVERDKIRKQSSEFQDLSRLLKLTADDLSTLQHSSLTMAARCDKDEQDLHGFCEME